ncbi:MAG: hypothetical protein IPM57_06320 [Oligoflexia bacterium]|nr:hypothetical protein [Oligoflexia bacterium]
MIKLFISVLLLASSGLAQEKNKIDLDDMMIKGELHNDDRINIMARQKNELKNYIKFRTSYKEEILQELPVSNPVKKFY